MFQFLFLRPIIIIIIIIIISLVRVYFAVVIYL